MKDRARGKHSFYLLCPDVPRHSSHSECGFSFAFFQVLVPHHLTPWSPHALFLADCLLTVPTACTFVLSHTGSPPSPTPSPTTFEAHLLVSSRPPPVGSLDQSELSASSLTPSSTGPGQASVPLSHRPFYHSDKDLWWGLGVATKEHVLVARFRGSTQQAE